MNNNDSGAIGDVHQLNSTATTKHAVLKKRGVRAVTAVGLGAVSEIPVRPPPGTASKIDC